MSAIKIWYTVYYVCMMLCAYHGGTSEQESVHEKTVQSERLETTRSDIVFLEKYDQAIADIMQVTLDDGNSFYFLILDVKSIHHTASELAGNNQCQCEWGHGYMVGESTVQLQVCEFITAGDCSVSSAIHAKSGAFLKHRSVVETQIIDHILICD